VEDATAKFDSGIAVVLASPSPKDVTLIEHHASSPFSFRLDASEAIAESLRPVTRI
jgi:hypothetical protein